GVLSDVVPEIRCLWIQAAAYFGFACIVYGVEKRRAYRHAHERFELLRKKREIRLQLKGKKVGE
ncbi:MAG: hypothetical protein IKU49_00155, partial [Prevotella sp.]|nr:hypothetical protein [Prevotella sp.]